MTSLALQPGKLLSLHPLPAVSWRPARLPWGGPILIQSVGKCCISKLWSNVYFNSNYRHLSSYQLSDCNPMDGVDPEHDCDLILLKSLYMPLQCTGSIVLPVIHTGCITTVRDSEPRRAVHKWPKHWLRHRSRISHKCSIGLRSGDWDGHGIWFTLFSCSSNHSVTTCALWIGALTSYGGVTMLA